MSSGSTPIICRRVEDLPAGADIADFNGGRPTTKANCERCEKPIYIEADLETNPDEAICLHCAVAENPNFVLFVELRPDEFGCRSISVTAGQVLERDSGEWHKGGAWHDPRWALNNVE